MTASQQQYTIKTQTATLTSTSASLAAVSTVIPYSQFFYGFAKSSVRTTISIEQQEQWQRSFLRAVTPPTSWSEAEPPSRPPVSFEITIFTYLSWATLALHGNPFTSMSTPAGIIKITAHFTCTSENLVP